VATAVAAALFIASFAAAPALAQQQFITVGTGGITLTGLGLRMTEFVE
jgi:hypothetical protein